MFEVKSKALPVFFSTLVANFSPVVAETFPQLSKKIHDSSASIVLSLTILDFFLSQITHFPKLIYSLYQFFCEISSDQQCSSYHSSAFHQRKNY